MNKVFIIPDTHFPFHSKRAYAKMIDLIKLEKPTHVVQIGDLLDQYVFSKYNRDLRITPSDDVKRGIKYAQEMWKTIQEIVPKAKCYQILGNHDMRMAKRISERIPELQDFIDLTAMYKFKGVESMQSDKQHLEIDGVIYVHGWLSRTIDHAKYFNKPTVHGHRHRPEIVYDNDRLWSLDVGYLADKNSIPLNYRPTQYSRWTTACGIVENKQPRIVRL